jgi:hypothetical protein
MINLNSIYLLLLYFIFLCLYNTRTATDPKNITSDIFVLLSNCCTKVHLWHPCRVAGAATVSYNFNSSSDNNNNTLWVTSTSALPANRFPAVRNPLQLLNNTHNPFMSTFVTISQHLQQSCANLQFQRRFSHFLLPVMYKVVQMFPQYHSSVILVHPTAALYATSSICFYTTHSAHCR